MSLQRFASELAWLIADVFVKNPRKASLWTRFAEGFLLCTILSALGVISLVSLTFAVRLYFDRRKVRLSRQALQQYTEARRSRDSISNTSFTHGSIANGNTTNCNIGKKGVVHREEGVVRGGSGSGSSGHSTDLKSSSRSGQLKGAMASVIRVFGMSRVTAWLSTKRTDSSSAESRAVLPVGGSPKNRNFDHLSSKMNIVTKNTTS